MSSPPHPVAPRAGAALADGLRANLRRPLSTLLLLSLFVTVASGTIADATEAAFFMALVLLVVETYVEIAVILAAAEPDAEPSGDVWIRAAFARRTFWRYIGTSITVFFVTALGFLFLLLPGFYLAGRLGLSQAAAVTERLMPGAAMSRSNTVSAPARGTVALLFGVVQVLPAMGLQALAYSGAEAPSAVLIPVSVASVIATRIALVALVRLFITLRVDPESDPDPQFLD